MTRGKIIFVTDDKEMWMTAEFPNDMGMEALGQDIIQAYLAHAIDSYPHFEKFVYHFASRNFIECERELKFIDMRMLDKYEIDISDNWTDYLYIINDSDSDIKFHSKEEESMINTKSMAIVHYQSIVYDMHQPVVKKTADNILLDKDTFVEIMNRLKAGIQVTDEVNDVIAKHSKYLDRDYLSGEGLAINHMESVIQLLEILMFDKYNDIQFFIYECKCGMNKDLGEDQYGEPFHAPYDSPEELYDYLIDKAMEDC